MLHPAPRAPADRPSAKAAGTATERVYGGIYLAVLEHRLAPGAWLREVELAASFGVSRTVVRQALQRLAQHQVVELIHNRGARVPLPELADAGHVFEARRVAECEIARRLGGRLEAAQIARLRRIATQEASASARGDTAAAVRLSGEFHQALAQMHGNPVLARLLDSLLPTTSVLMSRFAAGGRLVCVAHRHVDLIEALAQSGPAAATEMKRHLAELQRELTRPAPAAAERALRDVFAAYREGPAAQGQGAKAAPASPPVRAVRPAPPVRPVRPVRAVHPVRPVRPVRPAR